MINLKEHLFIMLQEEAAKIQMAVSKTLRFGPDNHHPGETLKNKNAVFQEILDLIAVCEMLHEEGSIKKLDLEAYRMEIETVKRNKRMWIERAAGFGTLEDKEKKREKKTCSPYVCPVCSGTMEVPLDFYWGGSLSGDFSGAPSKKEAGVISVRVCKTCGGTGIVWR
jgi:hypothetical protein